MRMLRPNDRPPSDLPRRRRVAARAVSLVIAVAIVVLPAPASADTTVTITGGGFGHGIGMSQYGAYGQAVAGRDAAQILQHYYTGTELAVLPMPRIRVGLVQAAPSVSFTSSAGETGTGVIRIKAPGVRKALAEGDANDSWTLEAGRSGGILLFKNGAPAGDATAAPPSVVIKYRKFGSIVSVVQKSRAYAYGKLDIAAYASKSCPSGYCLRVVNELAMQKYLYGLGEVPSSWPVEALKAQVIAARTYAYRKHVTSGSHRTTCDCTIVDSAAEQVYLGDSKRTSSGTYWTRWTAAVDETAHVVILYGGEPIIAMYSASSGGHTENNENIWGTSAVPYLRGVPDPYDAVTSNPYHRWTVTMSWSEFSARLDAYFQTGTVSSFEIRAPLGVSGRVTAVRSTGGGVRIVGAEKTVLVSGAAVKSALGLRDTLFDVAYSN